MACVVLDIRRRLRDIDSRNGESNSADTVACVRVDAVQRTNGNEFLMDASVLLCRQTRSRALHVGGTVRSPSNNTSGRLPGVHAGDDLVSTVYSMARLRNDTEYQPTELIHVIELDVFTERVENLAAFKFNLQGVVSAVEVIRPVVRTVLAVVVDAYRVHLKPEREERDSCDRPDAVCVRDTARGW